MTLINKLKPVFYAWMAGMLMLSQAGIALGQGQTNNKLTPESFKVQGLDNEEILMKLFVGNFSDIEFKGDDDISYYLIFKSYVESYAKYCDPYLPANKIEMTEQQCATERVTRNGWGTVISRTCVRWVTVGTGLYAAPKMYKAKVKLENSVKDDYLRMMVGGLTRQSNPFGSAMKTIDLIRWGKSVQRDINYLIQTHSCKSPEIQHLQENLRLYALGKPPIRIAYNESLFAKPEPPPPDSQIFSELIDDLIFEDSRSWMINRYIEGSVSEVRVISTDDEGYPSKIVAQYRFRGFGGNKQGSVTVTFDEGLPDCLYFFDFPQRCKTPNKSVVVAYVQGNYQK